MNIAHQERNNASLMFSLSENTHSRNFLQSVHGIYCQFMFIGCNLIHSNCRNIIECFRQCCTSNIVGSSSLELKRQFVERGMLETDILYHFSSSLIRRKFVEPCFLAIKHTDTRRAIHLMSAEHIEIGIQILYIYRHMRNTLCSVYQNRNPVSMCSGNHFLHRIDCSKHIRNMCY